MSFSEAPANLAFDYFNYFTRLETVQIIKLNLRQRSLLLKVALVPRLNFLPTTVLQPGDRVGCVIEPFITQEQRGQIVRVALLARKKDASLLVNICSTIFCSARARVGVQSVRSTAEPASSRRRRCSEVSQTQSQKCRKHSLTRWSYGGKLPPLSPFLLNWP